MMPLRPVPAGFEAVATEKIEYLIHTFYCSHKQIVRWREELGITTKRYRTKSGRPVLQFDKDGVFICKYKSIEEAARQNNVKPQNIWKVIRGTAKSTGGYLWRYAD